MFSNTDAELKPKGEPDEWLRWCSPEMVVSPGRAADEPSCVYTLGVIASEILTGRIPFPELTNREVKARRQTGLQTPDIAGAGPLWECIKKCLEPVGSRGTFSELRGMLQPLTPSQVAHFSDVKEDEGEDGTLDQAKSGKQQEEGADGSNSNSDTFATKDVAEAIMNEKITHSAPPFSMVFHAAGTHKANSRSEHGTESQSC
jgi:hypothetical protein